MSWDWVDRDLTEWAKRTLPEFLLIAMQDPNNKEDCIARTPWESFVVCVAEVQINGEANLTGRKSQSLFEFELDIGIRLDIEREGKDDYWPGVVQMAHFDNVNLTPPIITRLEELPAPVADEVGWYVREGMGRRYIWHGLARWHAYAVRKWTQAEPPRFLDPYRDPELPPREPPFHVAEAAAPLSVAACSSSSSTLASAPASAPAPVIGKKQVEPVEVAAAEHARWLADEQASDTGAEPSSPSSLSAVDVALAKARRRTAEYGGASYDRQVQLRAAELCEAIERGDIMKAFSKLDDETVNCPHPSTGLCPLHCCVARGSKELLQMMIEGGADLNKKDLSGQTALMAAAKLGNTELSKMLLDRGADPTEQDLLGRTAADMVKAAPKHDKDKDRPLKNWREKLAGEPPAEDPAAQGNELRDLIDAKERPRKYGAMLLNALGERDHRTADAAIDAGGDVNMTNDKGDTPLLLLAKGKWKDLETAQLRLAEKACRAGAGVNAQNRQGNTPLLFAAHRGHTSLVEMLLESRADPAAANGEGNTALMYAAYGGHEAICTALLEAYAPVTVRNEHGLTAEETALRRGYKSCAVLIKAYELAPKKAGEAPGGGSSSSSSAPAIKTDKNKEELKGAFDYSKWNALEREMQEEEEFEEVTRTKEQQAAAKRPIPKFDDLGPEAFGLPPDTPWPPADPELTRKGPFDYSRWDKIVDDIEKRDKVKDRYDHFQQNPKYEWRDGQKMQVIF